MRGSTVCYAHGAQGAPVEVRATNQAVQHGLELAQTYGGRVLDTDPAELMLEEIRRTAGHVRWLEERITTTAPEDIAQQFWLWKRTTEVSGSRDAPDLLKVFAGVWMDLYQKERDRLLSACSRALQLGIEERKVRLAERTVDQMAGAIEWMLTRLGHDTSDPSVRNVAYEGLMRAGGSGPLAIETKEGGP